MSRSVFLTLVVCAAVLGGAWWLYPRLFPDEGGAALVVRVSGRDAGPVALGGTRRTASKPVTERDAGAVASSSSSSSSSSSLSSDADGGRVARAATVPAMADGGPAPATGAVLAPDAATATKTGAAGRPVLDQRATVVAVNGFAQSRRGQKGAWEKLATGQTLDERDAVRTGRSGEARLAVGEGIEVRVSPRSEFSIREIKEGLSRVRLESGHVSASVDEHGNRVLRVEAAGSDAVAESKGGAFGMVSDGRGQVAVATSRGEVKLRARGQVQALVAGEQSVVLKDQAPSAPRPIPSSLLLKVAEPVRKATNEAVTYVEGTTEPGSVVRVAGRTTPVSATGKFRVPVKLDEGKNRISVNVTDASGRERNETLPEIVLDREKPKIDAEVNWGN